MKYSPSYVKEQEAKQETRYGIEDELANITDKILDKAKTAKNTHEKAKHDVKGMNDNGKTNIKEVYAEGLFDPKIGSMMRKRTTLDESKKLVKKLDINAMKSSVRNNLPSKPKGQGGRGV